MKKEIISKFNEKPKTKIAWWGMGLGLSTLVVSQLLLGLFASFIRPMIDRAGGEKVGVPIGFSIMIFSFVLSISALTTCILAYKKGERSFILWIGFVPAILSGAFWIFMIIGEFVFPH
jgi:hypothetical protein